MADPAAGLSFQYRFQADQVVVYTVAVRGKVEVQMPDGLRSNPIQIDMRIVQRTLEVGPRLATMALTIESARVTQDGETAPLPEEGQRSMLTIDRRGVIEFLSGSSGWQGSEFAQMQFPEHPLRIGDSWVQEAVTRSEPPVRTRTRYTFAGLTTFKGRSCAAFDAELLLADGGNAPGQPGAVSKGRTLFDPDLGQVVSTEADSRFTFQIPVPDQPGILATTTTTIRTIMQMVETH